MYVAIKFFTSVLSGEENATDGSLKHTKNNKNTRNMIIFVFNFIDKQETQKHKTT